MTTTEAAQVLSEMRQFRADVDARFDRMAEQIGELKVAEAERRGRESNAPASAAPAESALSEAAARWLDRWTPINVVVLVLALAVLVGTMTADDFRSMSPWGPPPAKVEDDAAAWILDSNDPFTPAPRP